jgi:hypothetical protein
MTPKFCYILIQIQKIFLKKVMHFQKLEPLPLLHEVEFNKHGELQVGPMPTRPKTLDA